MAVFKPTEWNGLPITPRTFLVNVVLATGEPEILVRADSTRVYLKISAGGIDTAVVGFTNEINEFNGIGESFADTAIEWRWEYSGPVLQQALFIEPNIGGFVVVVDTLCVIPAVVEGRTLRRSQRRAERIKAAQLARRIQNRLGIVTSLEGRRRDAP